MNSVWSIFSSSSHARRALILQGILTMCCFSQLSLLSSELALAIRIDPFSLFPREVSLKVLGYTDAITLGRAAQVSRSWKELADDDLLWRNMCEQHIERKCEKCGWGLPLLNDKKRRRVKVPAHAHVPAPAAAPAAPVPAPQASQASSSSSSTSADGQPQALVQTDRMNVDDPTKPSSTGNLKRSITAAANAAALERRGISRPPSPGPPTKKQCVEPAPSSSSNAIISTSAAAQPRQQPMTRPWKSVYCERLLIERNWRGGRYIVRTLTGHTDGIMCLQFSESLNSPQFPILITGSYDRTARVWNLETGKELRKLTGHTRGVRCLQFDEMKLITGSMDRTLKIWNWRTGELMRTLEGHTAGIVCLHFNEEILASGSQDSNIKIWNFRNGECYTLQGHEDWINAVQLWSGPKRPIAAGTAPATGAANPGVESSTFLFSASDDGTIRLWDLQQRECLMMYEGHVGQVQSVKLVMLDEDAVLKLSTGGAGGPGAGKADAERRRVQLSHPTSGQQTSDGEDGGDADETTPPIGAPHCSYNPPNVPGGRLANTNRPDLPPRFYNEAAATASTASGSSRRFFADEAKQAEQRSASIPPHLLKLQARLSEAGLVEELPFDAEMADLDGGWSSLQESGNADRGTPSASAVRGGVQRSGETGTSKKRATSKSPSRRPCSKPRPVLLSGSLDNTIKIFDVRTGRCIRTLFGHVEGVWGVDVDKLRIVSGSHDKTIKIWDRDTAHCQNTLVGHRAAVTCVALGDDKIVSGGDDSEIKVWSFSPE